MKVHICVCVCVREVNVTLRSGIVRRTFSHPITTWEARAVNLPTRYIFILILFYHKKSICLYVHEVTVRLFSISILLNNFQKILFFIFIWAVRIVRSYELFVSNRVKLFDFWTEFEFSDNLNFRNYP